MLRPAGIANNAAETVTEMFRRAIDLRAGKQRLMRQIAAQKKGHK
jgi:hypothetical protein